MPILVDILEATFWPILAGINCKLPNTWTLFKQYNIIVSHSFSQWQEREKNIKGRETGKGNSSIGTRYRNFAVDTIFFHI